MKTQDIRKVGETSVGSIIEVTNQPIQDPAIVNELLTQVIIDTLKSNSTLTDLDYTFFEGWRSRNGFPGFAVSGRDAEARYQKGRDHLMSVKYYSQDLADRTDIPERLMSGPELVRLVLLYGIEVSANSPLDPYPLDPRWDSSNPHQGLAQLLKNLTAERDIDSRVTKPEGFYQQFEGEFDLKGPFDESVRKKLAEKDPLTNGGRYLLLVTSDREGNIEFERGNFVSALNGQYGGVSITGIHPLERDSSIGFPPDKIIAVYGKGLEPLYLAKKASK